MIDIKSLYYNELENFITDNGFPKFRAKQISDWLSKGVTSFSQMRNIPKNIIDFLS